MATLAPAPLHPQRGIRRALRGTGQSRRCAWDTVTDLLVVDLGGVDQIRAVHPSRQQPGRRRHHGVDGAGPSRRYTLPALEQNAGPAWIVRCRAVLW